MISLEVIENFCFKEPNSGCWIWEKATGKGHDTYGRVWDREDKKVKRSHRAAWEAAVGPIPDDMQVCHKCDTPSCCRPDHLFLGTNKDNRQDMARKFRSLYGERGTNAKLTTEQALKIFNDDRLHKIIAVEYGINAATVCEIKTGRKWQKITGADPYQEGGKRRRASSNGLKIGTIDYKRPPLKGFKVGEKSRLAKVTDEQARLIVSDPRTLKTIAQQYGLSIAGVSDIKTGRCRSAVTGITYVRKQKVRN